ncbi:hypothetical protein O7627_02315 [Solwaraspora sp. WMMD1047]|uniref:hypothetical protein n=1 Tax=Solwaraspora sp. WMMD1047 TaxID=3016102 RepID=UPI002417DC95|nr:hypothetical protein [Solwaraspora sp. WMMD1047]MDG4828138.1 hypothetical protein [Solwaraspora sp. WMMD1047]
MTVQTAHLDLIRLMIKGDAETYRERCAALDQAGWDGFGLVVSAAFYNAVQDRFGPSSTTNDVIRFVADARQNIGHTNFDVDPVAAETLIQAARSGNTEEMEKLPTETVIETEMLLVWNLLEGVTDDGLETFLSAAEHLARQWERAS